MKRHLALLAVVPMALSLGGIATASGPYDGVNEQQKHQAHSPEDGVVDTPLEEHEAHGHDHGQHGGLAGHIPPTQLNMDVVGTWKFPGAKNSPGRITDVWSLDDHAYLGTFAPPCTALGVHVVDISDPANPQKTTFIPSRPDTRVNDVKAFHFDGLASGFTGDVLLHSNENCGTHQNRVGGISLWDVSTPAAPVSLAEGVGDTNHGELPRARQVHNIYAWQDGDRAYAAIVDDEELLDVDILDITDPADPVHVGETGLPDWPGVNVDGFGDNAFVHDIWARKATFTSTTGKGKNKETTTSERWELLLSYWDAGFIRLDVSDPANPEFIAESDYPTPDPLLEAATGMTLQPEGNAHAGVWDTTGDLILAGDEDFSPYRLSFSIASGTNAGDYDAGEFGWTKPITTFPGSQINGPTIYGGTGCVEDVNGNGTSDRAEVPSASTVSAGADEEKVVVFTRGTCFFSDKVHSGELAGYDAVIIGNHHNGSGGGAFPDAFICGSQGSAVDGTAAGLCIGHRPMHLLFNDAPEYAPASSNDSPDMPPIGTLGEDVFASATFDGWGPFHLIDNASMREIDAWAPSEVYDEAFAQGFGDLTMHNVEAFGPGKAAIAWYSLGMRILDFSGCSAEAPKGKPSGGQVDPGCITEAGRYVDANGNNFWGVHVTEDELILGSDRDSGLWIFEYTG